MRGRTGWSAALLVVALWGLAALPAAAAGDECFYCGMRRADYGYSWVQIHFPKGSVYGFCSLHCASIHMALHPEAVPREILVSDYGTHRLIDADKAYWVIGGSKPGVMTARAKWAFARREEAERFVRQYGGRLATATEAIRAAGEDMSRDIQVIQKKRDAARSKTMEQNRE